MKSTAIACAIAAGALGFGTLSYADSYDDERRDRRGFSQREHRWDRDDRESHRDHREARRSSHIVQQPPVVPEYNRGRHNQYRQHNQYGQYDHYRRDGQWAARSHRFQRGEQVPYQYRQRQYYVNDWRSHQLYAPPHGYQWVQADDGDYLLMALATGLIVNLMLNQ